MQRKSDSGVESSSGRLSRRRLLQGATAVASGIALGSRTVSAGTSGVQAPAVTPTFEECEWGYVREDFEPPDEVKGVVLMMDGYDAASRREYPSHYLRMRDGALIALDVGPPFAYYKRILSDNYLLVWGSLRGTACSGGKFELFDRKQARDGFEVIEWLADRPWSLDRVGLFGSSYSGLTAYHIASTAPPSLAAVSASTPIGDLYRGIAYPGGVPNTKFPVLWTGLIRRRDDREGAVKGVLSEDAICAHNVATRGPRDPRKDATLNLSTRRTDGPYYQDHSILRYADAIEAPVFTAHAWLDEQTGPRGGPEVFDAISPEPAAPPGGGRVHQEPNLLRAAFGRHDTAFAIQLRDAQRWFDYWMRGKETGIMEEPPVRLTVNTGTSAEGTIGLEAFPGRKTDWTTYYLRADGGLSTSPPADGEGGVDSYLTGSKRQSWTYEDQEAGGEVTMADGPDVLTYRSAPRSETAMIAGPMTATLYVESTTTDMDLFVRVADQNVDTGYVVPVQRGMLRASHRELDEDWTTYNDDGEIVRPYHTHVDPDPIDPGEIYRYDVEIFPLGHVLYAGHRLVVRIHTPPASDGRWGYEPIQTPGENRLYRGPDRPSGLRVPLLSSPDVPEARPGAPTCARPEGFGQPEGYRCYRY
jgi:putative CocE/NonD family hydrolase